MSGTATLTRTKSSGGAGVGIITLDHAPVNSLSSTVVLALIDCVLEARNDPSLVAIVVCGAARAFCAGADISEFSKKRAPQKRVIDGVEEEMGLVLAIDLLEKSSKPTVALVHGFALGGGCEVALGCHYRVSEETAKFGLPEIDLGLLPGAGGTQRLPRLIGVGEAAKVMLSGVPMGAVKAHKVGLVDKIFPGKGKTASVWLPDAVDFAAEKASQLKEKKSFPPRIREISLVPTDEDLKALESLKRSIGQRRRGEPAVGEICEVIKGAFGKNGGKEETEREFKGGMEREREGFTKLSGSLEAKSLQYLFFASRAAGKIGGDRMGKKEKGDVVVKKVGVVGAGLMGGGIAMCCANVGLPVVILDIDEKGLQKGLNTIKKNYMTSVARKKLSKEQAEKTFSLISGSTNYNDLSDVDIVIEAVFEDMKIKKQIFQRLDQICKKGAILASNTSRLSIDEIAGATKRPEDVIGCHFFSPANVMKLLENVRGEKTSARTMRTAMDFGKKLRKITILVGNCDGFVANRIMAFYTQEAVAMAMEGAPIDFIDRTAQKFGFPMGPFSMTDLVGVDLTGRQRETKGIAEPSRNIGDFLYRAGRFGQKNGKGFYDYVVPEGAKKGVRPRPVMSPLVGEAIQEIAKNLGVNKREITEQEIFDRLILPVANEGMRVVEEGIVEKWSDVDMSVIFGYAFPKTKGGPLFYARQMGFQTVVQKLEHYQSHSSTGTRDYWTPSKLLLECVEQGEENPDKAKKNLKAKM